MTEFKAGFAQNDISPETPVQGRLGINHMIYPYQPISAKALALTNGREKHLIISCETVGFTQSVNKRIKDIISSRTEINQDNIVIVCTHTHASPWVWDLQAEEAAAEGFDVLDHAWLEKVIANTAQTGMQAMKSMKKCSLRFGKAETQGIASNRVHPVTRWSICADDETRNAPVGLTDPYVRTISIHPDDRMPAMALANLACHPSAYGGGKTTGVSPDFPYAAEINLREFFGGEFIMAYLQGCAGNINSGKYVKEGSGEEVDSIGNSLAESIKEAIAGAMDMAAMEVPYLYHYKKFNLPVGDFVKSPCEARRQFSVVCDKIKKQDSISDGDVHEWRLALKQLDVSLLSDGKRMEIEFQLFRFRDTDMLFVPGEWFVQLYEGLSKANGARNLIVTTMNNFDLLYIPDEGSMKNKEWYGVRTGMRTLGNESAMLLYKEAAAMLCKSRIPSLDKERRKGGSQYDVCRKWHGAGDSR
ncbi:MAG: hypothetical protein R6W99_05125 [Clostridia bacterium]